MGKPVLPYANNKGAAQPTQNFKTLASLCSCAGRFVPGDKFSRDVAHIVSLTS